MLYCFFLFFILFSFDLSANLIQPKIQTIEQFNQIGLLEWQRDILNSNLRQGHIVQLLTGLRVSDEQKEEFIEKISAWRLVCFLHGNKHVRNAGIHNAYADFRDSLNQVQLAKLNSKYNMFLLKLFGGIGVTYAGLVLLASYLEQKAKQVSIVLLQNA